ncbi:MAG: response regulator [Magnetococcus sp. WYHC-3]
MSASRDEVGILCVDDEAVILSSLRDTLLGRLPPDLRIEFAQDGEEALEIADEFAAEGIELGVVVCDYIMPRMRGDVLLETLHQRVPRCLKIVLTGQADLDAVERIVRRVELFRFLQKPWNNEDLVLTLSRAVESYRMRRDLDRHHAALELAVEERTRELVLARDAAAQANRLKTRFLGAISHEIRTPMAVLLGACRLLADTPLNPDQEELVGTLRRSGDSLLELLNDLVEFSRLDLGALTLQPHPFVPAELCRSAVAPLEHLAREQGIGLHCHVDAPGDSRVLGDFHRLRQVLTHLLVNALRHTREGHVTLALTQQPEPNGSWRLTWTVSDTGAGMTPAQVSRLFQPDPPDPGTAGLTTLGLGLGLSISHRLVETMGGSLTVQSTPGSGSRFTVALVLPPAPARTPGSRGPQRSRPLRLLVVEDTDLSRMVLVRILESREHQVVAVGNGVDAVQAATEHPFDMILMDLKMPGMDGLQAARAIRALPGLADAPPIIALSASMSAELETHCLAAGMAGVMLKPLSLERFDTLAEQLISGPGGTD